MLKKINQVYIVKRFLNAISIFLILGLAYELGKNDFLSQSTLFLTLGLLFIAFLEYLIDVKSENKNKNES